MVEMQMIGGADHQEIEGFACNQRFRGIVGLAGGNAVFRQARQARRCRIDIADDLEIRVDVLQHSTEIAEAKSKTYYADLHAFCFPVF
ncbi:hypothetical protein D3C87_1778130 [compost metagenome]